MNSPETLVPLLESEKIHLKLIAGIPVDLSSPFAIDLSIANLEGLGSEILSDWKAHVQERFAALAPYDDLLNAAQDFSTLNEWVSYACWFVNQTNAKQAYIASAHWSSAINALMFATTNILFPTTQISGTVQNFVRDALEVLNTLALRRLLEHWEDAE